MTLLKLFDIKIYGHSITSALHRNMLSLWILSIGDLTMYHLVVTLCSYSLLVDVLHDKLGCGEFMVDNGDGTFYPPASMEQLINIYATQNTSLQHCIVSSVMVSSQKSRKLSLLNCWAPQLIQSVYLNLVLCYKFSICT